MTFALQSVEPLSSSELFGPENRRRCIEKLKKIPGYRTFAKPRSVSAVLIPLCLVNSIPSMLFIRRPLTLRNHPGEIGFPGGRCDPDDAGDAIRTALRETEEEVGLSPESVDVWITMKCMNSRSTVYPVVGFCGELDLKLSPLEEGGDSIGSRLSPNPSEVSYCLARSISWLTNPNNIGYTEFRYFPSYFDPNIPIRSQEPGRTLPQDQQLHELRYTSPLFGSLVQTGSPGPRIWGLSAIVAYQVLHCLIPSGLFVSAPTGTRLSHLVRTS
ncbi:unnamed protein product [Calicophoron daubneyi]|uniref:Nudix hydrolase domain-containing protein n=1 Tax=Calicophoron daubneyi TaxID=300641 RepID=A0AAV2T9S3_CALDB